MRHDMFEIVGRMFDRGQRPKWPETWHEPQFSPLFDARTGRTCIAMLIAVRVPLFDFSGPDPREIDGHATRIAHVVRAQWTRDEASKASRLITSDPPETFQAILEFAANGAYATRTQQVRAEFDFDGTRIGLLREAGRAFDDQTVFQSVTL